MKRKDFLGRLIGELTNFMLEGNPLRLVVSLHQEDDGAHISFFDDRPRSEKELDQIRKASHPKYRGSASDVAKAGINLLNETGLLLEGLFMVLKGHIDHDVG